MDNATLKRMPQLILKRQVTVAVTVFLLLHLTGTSQQQYPACFNNLVRDIAAMHKTNSCEGSDKLLRIDEFSYRDTILYQLVFQKANPCPDYIHTAIFYDNYCQVKIETRDGGLKYRHQVIPAYADTRQLVFVKSFNDQNATVRPVILKNAPILTVTDNGNSLRNFYLNLNVEALWIAGNHINWQTGEADKPDATTGIHTHCSAFVAAACKKLGIYVLRPPEHKQELLSNAQFEWLASPQGINAGWRKVEGNSVYAQAQSYANRGMVVIAICKNPDDTKPGHVALVMPGDMANEKLENEGPKLIMAGTHNFNKISLKAGFKSHLAGWPENVVQFYYNINTPQFPLITQ